MYFSNLTSSLAPPDESSPRTMSTTSSDSFSLSGVRRSVIMSCWIRWRSRICSEITKNIVLKLCTFVFTLWTTNFTPSKLHSDIIYLGFNFASYLLESLCSVDVLTISYAMNVQKNSWFAINKPVEDVFLKSREVVLDVLTTPHGK